MGPVTETTTHMTFGPWTVLSRLGRGGQGQTLLVAGPSTGAPCVLKLLRLGDVERWSAIDRFRRETDVLRSLDHPQIPRWLDAFEDPDNGLWGLVQDFVDGETLDALRTAGPPPSPERLEALLRSALVPLGYLHSRVPPVIHRDLSPKNLIVSHDRVHIVDFGAVKAIGGDGASVTAVGTFGYMPLEQARGQAVASSDLYALGMSFVSLATGLAPDDLPLDRATGRVDVVRAFEGLGHKPSLVSALTAMTEPGLAARVPSVEGAIDLLDGHNAAPARAAHKAPRWPKLLAGFGALMVALFVAVFIATPGRDPRERARLGGLFSGHAPLVGDAPFIHGAVFSPDSTRVGSFDSGRILLWDLAGSEIVGDFSRNDGEFPGAFRAAFSHDGSQFLASASDAASLWKGGVHAPLEVRQHAWRHAGRPSHDLSLRALGVTAVGGWRLAFDAWGEQLVVIDPVSGARVWGMALEGDAQVEAAFTAEGARLAFATGTSRTLRLIELASGRELQRASLPGTAPLSALAVSPAGERIAVATAADVTLVETASMARRTLDVPFGRDSGRLHSDRPLAFSRDGLRLAIGFDDGFRIFDASSGAALDTVRVTPRVSGLAFSPDGRTMAVTGERAIHLFDLTTPEPGR